MDYIVMDLEWNQSPYRSATEGEENALPFEIIEIGAVKLTQGLEYEDEYDAIIRPAVYKRINRKVKEITHISNSDLKSGRGFKRTVLEFLDWCGDDYMFCTWGTMDLAELQRNMSFFGFERILDFPLKFLDLQKLFSLRYEEDGHVRRTLQYAVEFFGLAESVPFHRALSDAKYTALIMQAMDIEPVKSHYSIDTFYRPRVEEEQIYAAFDDYTKFISREFFTRDEMLEDDEVMAMTCDKCGAPLKKKIDWFSDSGKTYYCLGTCSEHGYVRGRLKVKKTEDEMFWCIKILKSTDDDGAEHIAQKQEAIRERRRERRQKAGDRTREAAVWDNEPDEEEDDPET